MHALGFSVQLYGFFRNGRGEPRTARNAAGRPPLHSKYGASTHAAFLVGWVMLSSMTDNFPRYFLYLAGSDTVRRVVREGWEVAGGQVGGLLDLCGRSLLAHLCTPFPLFLFLSFLDSPGEQDRTHAGHSQGAQGSPEALQVSCSGGRRARGPGRLRHRHDPLGEAGVRGRGHDRKPPAT